MSAGNALGDDSSALVGRPGVLVIDDQRSVREALQLALGSDYKVVVASSGAEGLGLLSPSIYAVVLDIKMPGKDGFWTYDAIRKRFEDVPIIFFSAFQDLKDPYEIMNQYRPFGYLRKGDDLDALTSLLDEAIAQCSRRRRNEAQLFVADRLAAVGTLAAGVAHEINNPLSFVMGNIEHVLDIAENLPPTELSQLEDIQGSLSAALEGTERIATTITELRSFARPDLHERSMLDVHQPLGAAIRMAENQISHRARLVKELAQVPRIESSSSRLSQVFLNLLLNAAQALPIGHVDKHEIRVATRQLGAEWVAVEVSDTGNGIPENIRQRIFDPFFTTKEVGRGTGLGLFVSHNLIHSLGGKLELVDSRENPRTTFRVVLPVVANARPTRPAKAPRAKPVPPAEAPSSASPPRPSAVRATATAKTAAPAAKPGPRSRRLLLVDDEPLILSYLSRLLRDHDVTLAENGRKAVELCRQEEFEIIFCDMMMPDLSGMDVYLHLQELKPGLEQRIVFLTGGAFTKREGDFLERVDNVLLPKPIDRSLVLRVIASEKRFPRIP